MKPAFNKRDYGIFILAVISLAVFVGMYPRLFPDAAIRVRIDQSEALNRASSFLHDVGFEVESDKPQITLTQDAEQLRYLQKSFGPTDSKRLIADSIPVFRWEFRWKRSVSDSNLTLHFGGGSTGERADAILLQIDLKGRPVVFRFNPEDDTFYNSPTGQKSRIPDRKLIERWLGESIDNWRPVTLDHNLQPDSMGDFRWKRLETLAGENVSLRIQMANNRVRIFEKTFVPSARFKTAPNEDWFEIVSFIVVYLFFIVLGIIFFVRRIRQDLLDLKSGIIPGLFALVGWLIVFWNEVGNKHTPEMVVGFFVTAPFILGGLWFLFVLGESCTREIWPEKLITYDNLRRRRQCPELGVSIIRGLSLSWLILGLLAVQTACARLFGGYISLDSQCLKVWETAFPSLYVLGRSLFDQLYIAIAFCLFFQSCLKKHIVRIPLVLAIVSGMWMFVSFPLPVIQPFYLRMIAGAITGLVFAGFYYKFDFITVMIGAVSVPFGYYGIQTLYGGGRYFIHGLLLVGAQAVLAGVAFWIYRKSNALEESAPYVPDYVQRIYERDRIHRELEIARNVQLSFLPSQTPKLEGIDVASVCIPAREVGGDYYDFIEFSPRKLGVVIGDVSDKGIPAAFYMTLTKGLLKSQARSGLTPEHVLIRLNSLFYENAKRNVFLSMIYGVINLEDNTFDFARAGHNPIILHRFGQSGTEELNPRGLALGLEPGPIFEKTIENQRVLIRPGDIFFLYTDGFNEARNRFQEEFGEKRLMNIIETYNQLSAEELLNQIREEILLFTSGAVQHDDMTAVVIKIM